MISNKLGLNKKDLFVYGEWQQPLFSASFWVHWYNKKLCKQFGFKNLTGRAMELNGYTIVDKNDLEKIKFIYKQACEGKDKDFMKNFKRMSLKVINDYLRWLEIGKKENIKQRFENFVIYSERVMVPWYLSVVLSDYAGELLVETAKKFGFSSSEIMNYLPDKETLLIKEQRQAIKIKGVLDQAGFLNGLGGFNFEKLDDLKNNKILYKLVSQHVKKYEWLGTHHLWGESFTLEKFLNELKNYKLADKKQKNKKVKLPSRLKLMLEYAGELSYIRTYSPEAYDLVAYQLKKFFELVARKLGLTYLKMLYLTPREVSDLLESGKQPNENNLSKRKKDFFILTKKNKEIILQNKEDIDKLKVFFIASAKQTNELFGSSAFGGKISGQVKVFLRPENFSKMNDGDILIATMTTPDFVPLMKKAGAIVTDVGGLLSHAAIISRELKTPCVIGTQVATKIFKDGDMIEVDADKGIVKKI